MRSRKPTAGPVRRRIRQLVSRAGGARVVMQMAAVAAGAVFTSLAGWQFSEATGAWQEAVRVEIGQSNVYEFTARQVYADEGQLAFRIAAIEIRADAYREIQETNPQARTLGEVADQTAFALRRAAPRDTLAGDRQYDLPSGGSDTLRRLTIVTDGQVPTPDPSIPARTGDEHARTAQRIVWLTALATALAMAGACLPAPGQRAAGQRRSSRPRFELFPQPGETPHRRRRVARILLVLWAAGTLLPLAQVTLGAAEQHAQAQSARLAIRENASRTISLTRQAFRATAEQTLAEIDIAATARTIGIVYDPDPATQARTQALASAEETAVDRARKVIGGMARDPRREDGLETPLFEALTSDQADWDLTAARARSETTKAEAFGRASNVILGLIGLVLVYEARVQHRHSRP